MTTNSKFFWYGIVPALFFQLVGAIFYFWIFADSSIVQTLYGATKVLILLWPLLWIWGLKASLPPVSKELSIPKRSQSVGEGILSGLVIGGSILGVFFLFQDFFSTFAPQIEAKISDFGIGEHYLLFSIFLSLTHSLLEEYYWRWFVFRGLMEKFSALKSGIMGSIAFGLHHFVVLLQFCEWQWALLLTFGVMVGGAFWCFLYACTRSLLGSWISHIAADAALMYAGYILVFS